jgi:heme-degrading monooxygenase HmoA
MAMFVVVFEMEPKPEQWDAYLAQVAELQSGLIGHDGYLDNRRFRNRNRKGWFLSLSMWREEAAMRRWREFEPHRRAQVIGRESIFLNYRLRVGEVIADSGLTFHMDTQDVTAVGASRVLSLIDAPIALAPLGVTESATFDTLDTPSRRMMMLGWAEEREAMTDPYGRGARRLDVRVVRDYGSHDRREAP